MYHNTLSISSGDGELREGVERVVTDRVYRDVSDTCIDMYQSLLMYHNCSSVYHYVSEMYP